MFSRLGELFEELETFITDASQSPWFYALLFSVAFLDSVVPIVPSEFSVIAGGVASGAGTLIDGRPLLSVFLVIITAATGAFLGDSLAYLLGRRSDRLIRRLFFRGEKGADRLVRTSAQIKKRGGLLLVTARFIPGGRTAMTFSCGLTAQPFLTWFTRWDLLAASLWATYAGVLGYVAGDIIDDQSTALWLAFGFALGLTLTIELVRWGLERRRESHAARSAHEV